MLQQLGGDIYDFEDGSRKDSEVPNWHNGRCQEDWNDNEDRKGKDPLGLSGNQSLA